MKNSFLGMNPILVALLSFIPGLGVVFSIALIVWWQSVEDEFRDGADAVMIGVFGFMLNGLCYLPFVLLYNSVFKYFSD